MATMPNFFLVGAMKAGTTSIYDQLDRHPDVYCSPIKEPNFFSDDIKVEEFEGTPVGCDADAFVQGPMSPPVHQAYVRRPETYQALFRRVAGESAIGECSPSYLYSRTAAANIRRVVPHARILMVLRNPVDRAISHYHMDCRIGLVCGTFAEVLAEDMAAPRKGWGISRLYIELGQYVAQVRRYLECFPAHQIKIIVFDDLRRDFNGVIDETLDFLEVDTARQDRELIASNPAKIPRAAGLNQVLHRLHLKPLIARYAPATLVDLGKRLYYRDAQRFGVTEEDRERLRALFHDEIVQLSTLIDRDLSGWLTRALASAGVAEPDDAMDDDAEPSGPASGLQQMHDPR